MEALVTFVPIAWVLFALWWMVSVRRHMSTQTETLIRVYELLVDEAEKRP